MFETISKKMYRSFIGVKSHAITYVHFPGLLDYECWMTNERRIVVDENEWKELTVGIFEPDHLWCVSVDEFPCSICKSGYLVSDCSVVNSVWYLFIRISWCLWRKDVIGFFFFFFG